MKRDPRSLKVVSLENAHLREKIDLMRSLKGQSDQQKILLNNTLESIVQSFAFNQANITSFNPIITNNIYAPLTLNYQVLMYAYTSHGLLQTLIDQPVLDAFRGGLEMSAGKELSSQDLKDVENFMRDEEWYDRIIDTIIWGRLFGGSAAVVGVDGQNTRAPLDIESISKGQKVKIYDASRWEFGQSWKGEEYYNFHGLMIHNSRVKTFSGKRAPWIIRQQLSGWGMSEIQRAQEPFNLYLRTMNVIYELLNEAKVDVYRLKNLNTNSGDAVGSSLVQRRIQQANQLKSYTSALVLDMDDEYVQKQITFSGLAEMANEARITFSGSVNMPMTKLFGLQARGMSSNEDDLEVYNTKVESEVEEPAQSTVRFFLRLACQIVHGVSTDIDFKWKPLRILKATEEEEVKDKQHKRALDLYDRGLASAQELAQIEHKQNLVPIELEQMKDGASPPEPPMLQYGDDKETEKGDKSDARA